MARRLLFFSPSDERLEGACHIDDGYTKGYTEDEMRQWADDLDRVLALSPEECARLRAADVERLPSDQQALRRAQAHYLDDPTMGIKGSVRPDGKIELDGGRHRAAYALERDVATLPVWVSGPERELDAVERTCARPSMVRAARDDVPWEPNANGGEVVNERASNHQNEPEKIGEAEPVERRSVDPELARKLGQTATRGEVEHPERTAKLEHAQRESGRVVVRGERARREVGGAAVRGAQRSEDKTSGPDRPPSPENRERS